jgi:hypothetical protein
MLLEPDGNLIVAGTLTQSSDVNMKENIKAVAARDVLERVAAVPVATWNFKSSPSGERHMGPMAQDFRAAFGLGPDERHISPLDVGGVALGAIQGLDQIYKEQAAQIETLKRENAQLEKRLKALEEAMLR